MGQIPIKSRTNMSATDSKSEYAPVATVDEKSKLEKMELDETKDGEEKVGLKPRLGLLQGCNIIVGSIIGSGIFVSPGGVLQNTGSINMALTVWIIAGIFSMIGAFCYAELGCMIKNSGADYAYIMITFGRFLAFMRLWVECIVVRPATTAIVALTFS